MSEPADLLSEVLRSVDALRLDMLQRRDDFISWSPQWCYHEGAVHTLEALAESLSSLIMA